MMSYPRQVPASPVRIEQAAHIMRIVVVLAAAVGAEESEDFAACDLQGDTVPLPFMVVKAFLRVPDYYCVAVAHCRRTSTGWPG